MRWNGCRPSPIPKKTHKVSKYWLRKFAIELAIYVDCPSCPARRGNNCISKNNKVSEGFNGYPPSVHVARQQIVEPIVNMLSLTAENALHLHQLCASPGIDYIIGTNEFCSTCGAPPGKICNLIFGKETVMSNHYPRILIANKFLKELIVWNKLSS